MKKFLLLLAMICLVYKASNAQIGITTIEVTSAGTDGNPTCCGLSPSSDGFVAGVRTTSRATGLPQQTDFGSNYYALGFGGEVILTFASAVQNIGGIDIKVYENTSGILPCPGSNPDRARIWVSQDRCSWVLIGNVCDPGTGPINISLPAYLTWVKFIKIKDITVAPAATPANNSKDGFDLDGVKGMAAYPFAPATNTTLFGAESVISLMQGTRKNGSTVAIANSISTKALGSPQNSDIASPVNFFSLGFGGTITLEFTRLIHRSSGNEIQIFETTPGSPSCASFPESAAVSGSLDGINWVSLGTVCQNGSVSIPSTAATLQYPSGYSLFGFIIYNFAVRYIKITDVSNVASAAFAATEDGYDLDGIFGKAACASPARLANPDEENAIEIAEEEADFLTMDVFPNPSTGNSTVKLTALKSSSVQIDVISITGKYIGRIFQGNPVNGTVSFNWDTSELASGIYLLRMNGSEETKTHRVVVQHN